MNQRKEGATYLKQKIQSALMNETHSKKHKRCLVGNTCTEATVKGH